MERAEVGSLLCLLGNLKCHWDSPVHTVMGIPGSVGTVAGKDRPAEHTGCS